MKNETAIKREMVNVFRTHPEVVLAQRVESIKLGDPDIEVYTSRGDVIKLEVKLNGGKCSTLQLFKLKNNNLAYLVDINTKTNYINAYYLSETKEVKKLKKDWTIHSRDYECLIRQILNDTLIRKLDMAINFINTEYPMAVGSPNYDQPLGSKPKPPVNEAE